MNRLIQPTATSFGCLALLLLVQGLAGQTPPPRHPHRPSPNAIPPAFSLSEVRSLDGLGNHPDHPSWGQAQTLLLRLTPPAFADGTDAPAGSTRPSPRLVSNLVCAQAETMPNLLGVSDLFYQWGQFIDHDITLVAVADPSEEFPIVVPTGDPWFDPSGTGTQQIPFERSYYEYVRGARMPANELSAFIDGSMIYGTDSALAASLRALDGSGRMRTSAGDLPPFSTVTLADGTVLELPFFETGDIRANEQFRLLALHTLMLREHNFWADHFHRQLPSADEETLFQMARTVVIAELQSITYQEWLPLLLGPRALPEYRGYRAQVNPTMSVEFNTAAYRFGHSLVSDELALLDAAGSHLPVSPVSLSEAFFNPQILVENGLAAILRGMSAQPAEELDARVVDGLRNFLFGAPGAGGLDLVSLNIQRGRDHGLGDWNSVRRALRLRPHRSFAQIAADAGTAAALQSAYGSVDQLDLWVGGLCERKIPGTMVGETFAAILRDQFQRLRDGDRFWHETSLPEPWRRYIRQVSLLDLVRRHTEIRDELQGNLFLARTIGD